MAYFYDFCANDVFVSLLLCSKWDVNTILIRALSRTPLLHLSRERTKTLPYTLFEYDNGASDKPCWNVVQILTQDCRQTIHEEWVKWIRDFGKETISRLSNAPSPTSTPHGKAITFGKDTAYKVPEDDILLSASEKLDAAPSHPSGETEKRPTKNRRLHQLWSHVWSDLVTSWWKCFAYTIALCSLVLAAASWYRHAQLEAVVKEYHIIKPVLKQDRKYAPVIHTMDSVILRDGIDEVCERVYGEKR